MLRTFVNSQRWLSKQFDEILPQKYRLDGNWEYICKVVPSYLTDNLVIYDVGGWKNPFLSPERKKHLNAKVIGIDIDKEELEKAPKDAYDEVICTDIMDFKGTNSADLVICQAVLEHVRDTEKAIVSIASMLKPGGLALIFVPSKNAIYAKINIMLPQEIKKKILHLISPGEENKKGFAAYYDKCTPKEIIEIAGKNTFLVKESFFYYKSSYFSFFFPAYFVWRLWILLFHSIFKEQSAETFSLVLKKKTA